MLEGMTTKQKVEWYAQQPLFDLPRFNAFIEKVGCHVSLLHKQHIGSSVCFLQFFFIFGHAPSFAGWVSAQGYDSFCLASKNFPSVSLFLQKQK